MPTITYSEGAGLNDARIGKLLTPLKSVIEAESDLQKKKGGALDYLFNVESSDRFGETIQYADEFGVFSASAEGGTPAQDSMMDTYSKFIEHIPFKKEFVITKEMIDDSVTGPAAEAVRRAQAFTRAYYKTLHQCAQKALTSTGTSVTYAGTAIDLTTADGVALWHNTHKYGKAEGHGQGTQSNYFYEARAASTDITKDEVQNMIDIGANKLRNLKDENGEVLGYVADTIIIPGNVPVFERYVRECLGSEGDATSSNNGTNINYGIYNLVILPDWQMASNTYEMIVMSSDANKNLAGNMFFNRIPLDVKSFVDDHTRNLINNGYCRFGIGFGSYKHMVRLASVANGSTVSNADSITL